MNPYVFEFLGTMMLVLIGDGVCANANLTRTKGSGTANWLFINAGWALAVYVAVVCAQDVSGAHLNPAVSVGLAAAGAGGFGWNDVLPYVIAQMAGAFAGAVLVYLAYVQHFAITEDPDAKLGSFATGPAIRGFGHNLFSEIVGTFVLVFAVLMASGAMLTMEDGIDVVEHKIGLGAVGALPVALVVFAIGAALGGTTGYAINPARDLGPRIAHAVLPIPGKRDSDWGYSWVPVLGPVLGGIVAAMIFRAAVPAGL